MSNVFCFFLTLPSDFVQFQHMPLFYDVRFWPLDPPKTLNTMCFIGSFQISQFLSAKLYIHICKKCLKFGFKIFEIARTIYSNIKRSEQCLCKRILFWLAYLWYSIFLLSLLRTWLSLIGHLLVSLFWTSLSLIDNLLMSLLVAGNKQWVVELQGRRRWVGRVDNCQFYNHFWPFFGQLYFYLSQKGGSDGHFEVLNRSEYWLVQKNLPQM